MIDTASATTYAFGAMLLYGAWSILANHSLEHMSVTAVLLVTYVVALGVIFALDPGVTDDIQLGWGLVFAVGTGIALAFGTVLYYQSVSMGKLSIIPAIPALYFVVSTVYGITILDESMTAMQLLGIVMACVAVGLLTQ